MSGITNPIARKFFRAGYREGQKEIMIDIEKAVTDAHMAGQADAGVDPSWSNALSYFEHDFKAEVRVPEGYNFIPHIEVELGKGDKLVSDIHNKEEGWGGIVIHYGSAEVGEIVDTGAEIDEELDVICRIITGNPKSLDVIIAACERAKTYFD